MCGIAGALVFPTEKKVPNRLRKMQLIFNEIMAETLDRGKHATGISVSGWKNTTLPSGGSHKQPYFGVLKGPYECGDFMYTEGDENPSKQNYSKMMKLWRDMDVDATAVIGHCRWKTQGDESDNLNNHPIIVPMSDPRIVGVHNGCVDNDHILFRELEMERDGLVDSEAIFKIMHYLGMGEDPPNLEDIDGAMKYIDGKYAVVGYFTKHPHMVFTFKYQKPLEFAVCADLDAIFIASETKFIKAAFARFNRRSLDLGWKKIEYKDFTNHENDGYLFDMTQPLVEDGTEHGIHKYRCVEKKAFSRTIYTDYRKPAAGVNNVNRGVNRGVGNVHNAGGVKQEPINHGTGTKKDDEKKTDEKKADEKKADTSTDTSAGKADTNTADNESKNLPTVVGANKQDQERVIEVDPRIHDLSDEDKEPLNVGGKAETVEAEVIKSSKEDPGALSEMGVICLELRSNVDDRLKVMASEIARECEGDPTTTLGSTFDSIEELKSSGEYDDPAADVVEKVFTSVVDEAVEYIRGQVMEQLDDSLKDLIEETNSLIKTKVEDAKKDTGSTTEESLRKTLTKELVKRKRAQDRCRVLTELLVATIECRPAAKKQDGRLARFIDENMPNTGEEKRKMLFDILSADGEVKRGAIVRAITDAIGSGDE